MSGKKQETTETVEENLFGGFKFIDKEVPKAVNKAKDKEVEVTDAAAEAEKKALAEALEAADKAKAKKATPETVEEEEVEEETVEVEDDKNGDKPEPESNLSMFARELSEKGLIDLDENDKIESDEDLFKAYQKTVQKGIAEDRSKLPEDAQKFLEFVDNGGKPSDFHKYYYSSEDGSFEDFTIEDIEDQKHVVREGLALEGYSPEEIEEEINDLVDLEKLPKKAEIQLKKLQKLEKEQKKLLIETQKEHAKKQEEERQRQWAEFKKGLFEKEQISGFSFTPKMKEDTWDYMTKIVDKKQGKTQYQLDSDTNPDARYMFAYLLKNKWDVKSLEKQVTNKAVGKLAGKLNNYSDSRAKLKQGTPAKEKAIEDGDNPFKGFKTIL